MKVTVLGAGSWGTTLAIVLENNGHEVTLWEFNKSYAKNLIKHRENKVFLPGVKIPEGIKITNDLNEATDNRHMIVIAIPTQFIRSSLEKLKKKDFKNTIFVSVSKGIEKGTILTVSGVIKDVLPKVRHDKIAALSGPSHAEEVSRKIPTAVVAAANDEEVAKIVQSAFANSYFRVYYTTDLIGVELGGAFKNVIAIGAGIIDGVGYGDNTKAAIMTRAIAEITRLGMEMGARRETFAGLSGMGDLIVTCMSRHSRNRYVGEQIGKGKKLKEVIASMKMVAEGVETCKSVNELAAKLQVDIPISRAVYDVLYNDADPQFVTYELMTREIKPEY
jgi:glycerol-3-phosphate dehydrogenase (NAD(P)+)